VCPDEGVSPRSSRQPVYTRRRMQPYRQSVPSLRVSIERDTPAVPPDGYYYVVQDGKILGRFHGLKQATARYKQLLADAGYEPPTAEPRKIDPTKEAVERYMDDLEAYWSDASNHRRRGGKSMYRS